MTYRSPRRMGRDDETADLADTAKVAAQLVELLQADLDPQALPEAMSLVKRLVEARVSGTGTAEPGDRRATAAMDHATAAAIHQRYPNLDRLKVG